MATQNTNDNNWDDFFNEVDDYLPKNGKSPKPWYGPDDINQYYTPELPPKEKMPDIYTVLITGERGSGKEFVANTLAKLWGGNGIKISCCINCGAIEPNLARSELFGYVKNAFTGATKDTDGFFSNYDKNNLFFMDELHQLPIDAQGALLRLIEYHETKKVGGKPGLLKKENWPRIIAATQPPYIKEDNKVLLKDLLDRFTFTVHVKPLRACNLMIPRLFSIFLYNAYKGVFYRENSLEDYIKITDKKAFKVRNKFKLLKFPEVNLWRMFAYTWPGNIRQLKKEAYQTTINDKNVVEIKLFNQMTYAEKEKQNHIMNKTFFLKDKGYNTELIKKNNNGVLTYNDRKKISLLELWNYKSFKQQRELYNRKVKMYVDVHGSSSYYDYKRDSLSKENDLIIEAKQEARKECFKMQELEKLSSKNGRPPKAKTLKELEQKYTKIKPWKKVAKYYGVSERTIHRWRKKL